MVNKTVRTEPPADPVTSQPASADHVESLEGLAAAAAAVDAGGEGGEGAPAPGAAVKLETNTTAEDVADMLKMGRAVLSPALVEAGMLKEGQLESIWTNDALLLIAKPVVSILDRHDMGLIEAFDKWGPYVMLLAGVAGPGFATYRAIRANAAEVAASAKQQ